MKITYQEIYDELGETDNQQLVRSMEKKFRRHIHHRIWQHNRRQLGWKILSALIFCVSVTRLIALSHQRIYTLAIYGVVLLLMLSMEGFVLYQMPKLPPTATRQSLLRATITWQVLLPTLLFNLVMTIPNIVSILTPYDLDAFINIHPAIALIILCFSAYYLESCYKTMNEK